MPESSFCIPQNQIHRGHLDFYFNACRWFRSACHSGRLPARCLVRFNFAGLSELLASSWDIGLQPSQCWPPQVVFAVSLLKKLLLLFLEKSFYFISKRGVCVCVCVWRGGGCMCLANGQPTVTAL